MKRIILILMMMVVLSFSVLGITQTSEWNSDQLTILYDKSYTYKKDNVAYLKFIVSDSSGDVLNNSNVDCDIHLYGADGNLILNTTLNKNANYIDLETDVNNTVLDYEYRVPYNVYCNTSTENGYLSDYFLVTNSGRYDDESGLKWISIVVLASMMALLFFLIAKGIESDKNNIAMRSIKMLFFLLSVINTFLLGFVIYAITLNPFDVISFRGIALVYLSISMILLILFIFLYGYYLLTTLFKEEV